MSVSETREIEGGLRRRRVCLSTSCGGRITTIEVVAPLNRGSVKAARGPMAVVKSSDLGALQDLEAIRDILRKVPP